METLTQFKRRSRAARKARFIEEVETMTDASLRGFATGTARNLAAASDSHGRGYFTTLLRVIGAELCRRDIY